MPALWGMVIICLFGHDGGDIDAWVNSDVPTGDSIRRVVREWRIDITGSPGDITIGIDTTLLPDRPSGYLDYVVFVDADGDFTDGAEVYSTILTNGEYQASNVEVSTGSYVSIGTLILTIEFTDSVTNAEETASTPIAINLNYPAESSVSFDYVIKSGSASGSGVDYSLTSGSVTILAGQTSAEIDPLVINDSEAESEENIEIALRNPSGGFRIGTDSVHNYKIIDEDNTRVIEFRSTCEFAYKKTITIDNTEVSGLADIVNFPVLISLTDTDLRTTANGGNVQNANGYDIFFTYKDSIKWLPHQLEKYTATTGEVVIWVKLPVLQYNTDTEIEMYYGNANITQDYSSTDVFSAYNAVYHLGNSLTDNSGSGFDGSNNNTTNTTGIIGDGRDFDGNDDFFELSSSVVPNTGDFSFSFWYNPDVNGTDYQIFDWSNQNTTPGKYFVFDFNGARQRFAFESNNDSDVNFNYATAPTTATWHFVTLVGGWNRTDNHIMYVNGVQRATSGTNTDGIFSPLIP